MSDNAASKFYINTRVFLLVVAYLLFLCANTKADLGGTGDSVERDRAVLKAESLQSTVMDLFTVYEITYTSTKVREYVANGKVFAVTWNGLSHPEPSKILGNYYSSYKASAQLKSESRHAKGSRYYSISTGNMVFEKAGHMRNVFGRAYDLTLFPTGVSLDDIK
jgi:hypothetical protein